MVDVAQRIRAENQRAVERSERPEPARAAVAAAASAPAIPAAAAAPSTVSASIETAAKAAIAAAVEDVAIRPLGPKPSLFLDPTPSAPEHLSPEMPEPAAFIPPQPERGPARPPRMPRLDELPVPAQNEIRARRGEVRDDDHPEKRRMSLLQRLASVGLGRREQDEAAGHLPAAPAGAPMGGPVSPERLVGRPMPRPAEPRQESRHDISRQELPVSEYARRPAPQGLDQHGRQAPVHNSSDEDQLDIPAFLRRQAK
jgi:cell division protein FtsZ